MITGNDVPKFTVDQGGADKTDKEKKLDEFINAKYLAKQNELKLNFLKDLDKEIKKLDSEKSFQVYAFSSLSWQTAKPSDIQQIETWLKDLAQVEQDIILNPSDNAKLNAIFKKISDKLASKGRNPSRHEVVNDFYNIHERYSTEVTINIERLDDTLSAIQKKFKGQVEKMDESELKTVVDKYVFFSECVLEKYYGKKNPLLKATLKDMQEEIEQLSIAKAWVVYSFTSFTSFGAKSEAPPHIKKIEEHLQNLDECLKTINNEKCNFRLNDIYSKIHEILTSLDPNPTRAKVVNAFDDKYKDRCNLLISTLIHNFEVAKWVELNLRETLPIEKMTDDDIRENITASFAARKLSSTAKSSTIELIRSEDPRSYQKVGYSNNK